MAYHHFTTENRFKIQSWMEIGLSKAEMARRLEKDYSAVLEEIKNNSYDNGRYKALHATALARRRRKEGKRKSKKLLCDKELKESLIKGLQKKKSPDQIMGERRLMGKSFGSVETVYSFIYSEERNLVSFLRQKKGKY